MKCPASSSGSPATWGAPLKRLGVEFSYAVEGAGWHYRGSVWDLPHLPAPALAGGAQFGNAATAIAALEEIADSGEEIAASGGEGGAL